MERHWKHLLLLLWFSQIFISGVLLFTRGFLLNREVLPQRSRCKTLDVCTSDNETNYYVDTGLHDVHRTPNIEKKHCAGRLHWTEENKSLGEQLTCQTHRARVVLIVIDALMYDFVHFNSNLKEEEAEVLPYQNRLPVINDLLISEPNHTKLFKFIADPPTTTMQRLKGLTTGSLPTFIDVGSNFATPEINEDNILDQLKSMHKDAVFMGDDTWSGLFPDRFLREYAYPSFNVWDLDTVDNGIMEHILPEVVKKDWSLLIAHFLGVDHCGHRYGPFHSEMSRKLGEMNEMIRSVVDTIDDNTMLFVIGDHGMTSTGDHGGDSEAEVTAAMFVYSPKPLLSPSIAPHSDSVKQVDLVPTLSAILGLPIPFSNLGAVILEAIPSLEKGKDLESDWTLALKTVWQNIQQTVDYINSYSQNTTQFSEDKLNALFKEFTTLKEKIIFISSVEDFISFSKLAKEYLTHVREMCEEVWVQFDSVLMFCGLILIFLSVSFIFLLVDGVPGDVLNQTITGTFLLALVSSIILTAVLATICSFLELVGNLEVTLYASTCLVSLGFMLNMVFYHWFTILLQCHNRLKISDSLTIAARVLLLCSLGGIFSNSYVVEEPRVLSYLVISMAWLLVYNYKHIKVESSVRGKAAEKLGWLNKSVLPPTRVKLIAFAVLLSVLIRISQYYLLCREEQMGCESFTSHKGHLFASIINLRYCNSQCLFSLICLSLFVTIARIWLRSCGNLVGFSPSVMLSRYGPTLIVVCTGGYWVLQGLPKHTRTKLFQPWQMQYLPWIAYGIIILGFLSMIVQPLAIFRVPKKKGSLTVPVYGQMNIIPQIFSQMKEMMQGHSDDGERNDFPIVYGLATVYSALFVNVGVFVTLFIALVLGIAASPSVVLMCTAGTVLVSLLSVLQYEKALLPAQLFNVPWSSVLSWGFLAMYFFYATGHNATFPGIQWEAAFVGTGGQFSNHIVPAILVMANTFASHIVFSLMLPVLLIVPFTLHIMFPKLLPSASKDPAKISELKRGELALYERDDLVFQASFSLCSRFILFLGVRMFACMLSATIHCRHLMIWKIFAPKFIFEGLGMFVSLPFILLSYLLVVRVTVQLEKLMQRLEKEEDR